MQQNRDPQINQNDPFLNQQLQEGVLQLQTLQQQPIYFGDLICIKVEGIGSKKYMHSEGFYPSCIKCIDYEDTGDNLTDIDGSIFEICNPIQYFSKQNRYQDNQSDLSDKNQNFNKNKTLVNTQSITSPSLFNQKNNYDTQDSLNKNLQAQQFESYSQNRVGADSYMQYDSNQSKDGVLKMNQQNMQSDEYFQLKAKTNKNRGSDEQTYLNSGEEHYENQVTLGFNQNFILRHKRSNKFLYLVEEDLEYYSLILSSKPSLFKISPSFKSQVVQTKTVYYNSFIYIQAVPFATASNKDIYLVIDEAMQYVNSSNYIAPGGGSFVSPKFTNYTCFFGDFFFSPNQKTCLHIEPYRQNLSYFQKIKGTQKGISNMNNENEQLFLRYGDVVKIFHIETESFFQYEDNQLIKFKSTEINEESNIVQEIDDEDDNEIHQNDNKISSTGFRSNQMFQKNNQIINNQMRQKKDEVILCKPTDDQNFNKSNTLWKIINPLNPLDGGFIRWEEKVVLKCLNKNVFLHIKEQTIGKKKTRQIKLKTSISDESECHFHFCQEYQHVELQGEEGQVYQNLENFNLIKINSLFRIVHSETNQTLSAQLYNEIDINKQQYDQNRQYNDAQPVLETPKRNSFYSSMTQSIIDQNFLPKIQISSIKQLSQDKKKTEITSEENEKIDMKQIVLKENYCEGDVLRFQQIEELELIESNYLTSTFELISSAIPLIKYYALISDKKDETSQKNIFQFTNPYFIEFTSLLSLSIQHQIKYLLDIEFSQDVTFDNSIFRKYKPNSEKQNLSSKRGILEYSVNLLKAMWGYQSDKKIQDILQSMKKSEDDFNNLESKAQSNQQSFLSVCSGRRGTQIKQFKSKIDQKDEQIQLYETFKKLSKLIYFLIITLCKNNSGISINTFNYFTFFKNHVGYSIGATNAIISILKNNEKLLNMIHTKNYHTLSEVKNTISRTLQKLNLKQFQKGNHNRFLSADWKSQNGLDNNNQQIQQVNKKKNTLVNVFFKKYEQVFQNSNNYWANFMDVMNIMCICKGEALNINQLIIGQELLANEDPVSSKNLQKMIIQIQCKEKKIFIQIYKKTYELKEFLDKEQIYFEKSKVQSNEYKFLVKQLGLYANLCKGRNYQNKLLLQDQITAQALTHYITNQNIKTELRAILLNLLINLHFDSCPRNKVQRPCYTKTLNSIKHNKTKPKKQSNPNINNSICYNIDVNQEPQQNENNQNQNLNISIGSEFIQYDLDEQGSKRVLSRSQRFQSDLFQNKSQINETKQDLQKSLLGGRKRFQSQKMNEESVQIEEVDENEIKKPSQIKDQNQNNLTKNIRPQYKSIFNNEQDNSNSAVFHEFSLNNFIQKDSMTNQQEMKQFVVNYLRCQIYNEHGQLKSDMLSYYVVKLARMMIIFDYFEKEEEEFFQIIQSLLFILQTQTKVPILEKLRNVYIRNKEHKKALHDQEKWKLMIIQEVLQTLLFYQSIQIDSNLRQIVEFITLVFQKFQRPSECTSKMDFDLYIKNMIQNRLSNYLPKLQNVQSYTIDNNSNQQNPAQSSQKQDRNKSVMNFNNSPKYYLSMLKQMSNLRDSSKKDVEVLSKYITFDDMLKNNSFFNIILQNFVSLGSSNIETSHLILKNLFANFSQRKNIIRQLKKLQIIMNEKEYYVFKYLKFLNIKTQFISEMQELWFRNDMKAIVSQKTAFGEINMLMQQINLAFYEAAEYDQKEKCLVSKKQLSDLIKEDQIFFCRQQMLRNLKMHKNILSIIREGNIMIQNINQIDKDSANQLEDQQMIIKMYESCYNFLFLFVKGNKFNQKVLFKYFELFLQNVGQFDIGQYKLLREIMKDNKKICNSITPEQIQKYITKIYKNGLNNNLEIIKFFEYLIQDHDEPAYQNIDKLVKCLLESEEFTNFFGLKLITKNSNLEQSPLKKTNAENLMDFNGQKTIINIQQENSIQQSIVNKQQGYSQSNIQVQSLPGQYEFNIDQNVIDLLSGDNTQYIEKSYKVDDLPFLYNQKSIEIANQILKYSLNPTKTRYIFNKLININYIYKLLSLDDIFDKVIDQTILFTYFKTTLMEFVKQVWLSNEKNSAKLNKNEFLIQFLKKETKKLFQIKDSMLVSYSEAMNARTGKEKILYLQNVQKQNSSFQSNSRNNSFLSKNIIRPSNSLLVEDKDQSEQNNINQQSSDDKKDEKIEVISEFGENKKDDQNQENDIIKTFHRTSQMKFNINYACDTNSEEEGKHDAQIFSSQSSNKFQISQKDLEKKEINVQAIYEERKESEIYYLDPQTQMIEEIIMLVQTDYIRYLFQCLIPFVMDTFKCFLGYDSQQANVNNRQDYEAFASFAKEVAVFCEYEITEEIYKKQKEMILPVLIEFQEIFKVNIDFQFDCKQEIQRYQKERNSKKQNQFEKQSKLEFKSRIIQDSRIQGIIQPLDGQFIYQGEEQRIRQEVANIILHLLTSDFVNQNLIIQERNHLVHALRDSHRSNNLSLQNFLKKLVNFVKNAIDNLEDDDSIILPEDDVLIDTIQLLCDILDSCTTNEELIYMQNFLNQNGIIKAMIQFFCQKNEIGKLFKSFISLGIRMIQGINCANFAIQESIYQQMTSEPNIEIFLAKIIEIIRQEIHFQAFENLSISQKIEAECKSLKFSYNKHRKFSIQKILRFLQLLIANCYTKMQRYLLNQYRSKTNHNILNHIVDLVEAYMGGRSFSQSKFKDGQSYYTDAVTCDKAVMALETLILLIQGPCIENQIELAESKFLEIATYILKLNDSYEQFTKVYKKQNSSEIFLNQEQSIIQIINQSTQEVNVIQNNISLFKEKLTERQKQLIQSAYEFCPLYSQQLSQIFREDHPSNYGVWMLSMIKNKCISCLESLMDGENKIITRRIMSDIPPNLLKVNLAWIYEKYEILYGEDKYYDFDLFQIKDVKQIRNELDKTTNKELKLRESLKDSFIIDSGFKIFRILRFILNQAGNNEIENIYNEIAKREALVFQIQSKKNIFSQLQNLLQDFAKLFTKIYSFIFRRKVLSNKMNQEKISSGVDKLKQKSLEFFSKYTGQIEIVQENKLCKISFPKYPHCFSLTNALKSKVTRHLNFYSPHTKVESIVKYADRLIERLKFEHLFKAKLEKNQSITILSNNLDLWKNLSYFICIAQNIYIILTLKHIPGEHDFYFRFIGQDRDFQLFLQLFQITLASLVLFFFLLKKIPLTHKKSIEKIQQMDLKKFSINEHTLHQNVIRTDYKTKLRNLKIRVGYIFKDTELLYFSIYFALALLGLFNEFFLALLLFDVFWRFPMLRSVLHAVWRPRESILLTMFLFFICTYMFSLTAFYFFVDQFNTLCDNLLTCYSVIFDYMYKNDGGITSFFAPNGPDDFLEYYGANYSLDWLSLWNFLYFFIIITLLFSIVTGIIIDTFGLLRDEEDQKKRNKKDSCLICSIDRAIIDKVSPHNQGFQHHIDVEHNLWNYIFYISYLKEKNRNYMLGAESEIYQKVKIKDISWFPLNRSLSVNQNQETNEEIDNLNKKIVNMESKLSIILQEILKNTKVSNKRILKMEQQQDLKQLNLFQNTQESNSMLFSTKMLQSTSKKLPQPIRTPKRSHSLWVPQKEQSAEIIEEEDQKKQLNTSLLSSQSVEASQEIQKPSINQNTSQVAQKLTNLMNRCESEDEQ
ncbi:MIR domain protein (macronuclear) [Tetrahymena thermophila SB210]|uniref:MIR domain protein n=1 Tax=Tetrahymena thermophila (strain SB210) TaxID=312017 RepID=Q22DA4_TETTS|nr:MIR domain protein [Tetrahymena thermophila SB210]EAR83298.2 MIR domain protein [Tetrahymena thermophila SB210]|eukprot:XP_001030961.2 MIR domain protein [Tetrahymena thermophila SB210]